MLNPHGMLPQYTVVGQSPSNCETTKKAPVDLRPVSESLGSELPSYYDVVIVTQSVFFRLCGFFADPRFFEAASTGEGKTLVSPPAPYTATGV